MSKESGQQWEKIKQVYKRMPYKSRINSPATTIIRGMKGDKYNREVNDLHFQMGIC